MQVKLTQNLTPIICCQLITSVLVSKPTHLCWDLSCNSLLAVIQTSESRVKSVLFLWGSRDFYRFCINRDYMIASPPELCPILVHLIHLPLKGVLILPAGAFGGVHAQLWVMKYLHLPKTNILTTDMYIATTSPGQNSKKPEYLKSIQQTLRGSDSIHQWQI